MTSKELKGQLRALRASTSVHALAIQGAIEDEIIRPGFDAESLLLSAQSMSSSLIQLCDRMGVDET